jgi:hypothetical protein
LVGGSPTCGAHSSMFALGEMICEIVVFVARRDGLGSG